MLTVEQWRLRPVLELYDVHLEDIHLKETLYANNQYYKCLLYNGCITERQQTCKHSDFCSTKIKTTNKGGESDRVLSSIE